ncbi:MULTISPECIES: hypothetical protein [Burkholderiales genera incertae sedis]|uniref:Uncharacterized protein n=1 Tax=Tepidicella xavieri TaxID=360241 RepID=A0A4V3D5Q7_9BURK|nr:MULTISPECIES: hypothetical protein [Burkholderiales genera incertae sedis]TDQ40977.1 hypothetical protein DFR43_11462 [Tepidicella xavieri]
MNPARLSRIVAAMPLGMGAGLFAARDLRPLAPSIHKRSDLDALRGDWRKIGGDFRVAVEKFQTEEAHRTR